MQYKFFAVLASIMLILGQGGARANGLESNGDELIIDHDSQPLSSEQTPSQDTNEKTIPDGVYLEGSDQPLAPTDNAKEDGHSVEIHDQNNNQWKEEFDHSTHSAIIDLPESEVGDKGQVTTTQDKNSNTSETSVLVNSEENQAQQNSAKTKKTIPFYGYDLEVDENNKVTVTPEMQALIKGLDHDVQEVLDAELLEIESEHVLFVHTKQVKNTPTKVFPGKSTSALKNKFKGTVTKDIAKLKAQWDETTIVAPSWVDTSKLNNKKRAGFHTVEINGKEAFTVKTDDFGWFYVAKKVEKPQPTIQTETFYTSTDKAFPVVMKDDQTVDIEESKKLLQNALPSITKQEDKELAEAFIAYADAAAELLEVEGKTLLFVKVNDHTTKVFHKEAGTHLKDAFKSSVATVGTVPSNADLTKAVSPTWITAGEQQDITHFIAVNDGYTLLTKSGHWFYAPIRLDIENFYGSNNKALQVVMQDPNTVDLAQTKKLLAPNIHLLPDDLKAEAQDFIDNGTQNDVVIKEIEGVKLLFVKTSKHTKVFRTPATDTMFQNAFKGGTNINIGVVYTDALIKPDWVDTSKPIVKYNEIRKADKVIGYALKTEDHHWFYAPKKEFALTPFYTSKNNIVPVVMKDAMTVDLPATKSVLYPLIKDITNPNDRTFAEQFIQTATENDIEIKEIEGIKILFVNLGTSTKAFAGQASSPFQNAFLNGSTDINNITYDPSKVQAPKWVNSSELPKKYNEVKKGDTIIGYTLKNKDNHWFYAPKRAGSSMAPINTATPITLKTFYYNPTTSFKVVIKDGKIDLTATAAISNLDTCTYYLDCEWGNELLTIQGEEALFAELDGSTPTVYFTKPDSKLQKVFPRNPKELQTSDFTYDSQNMVKPTWVSDEDRKDIAGHAELKEWEKLIGYGIRTKNGKWFYAPAAHRVNFEMNGANAIVDQIIPLDGKATKPSNPTRPGYNFSGWFADKDFKIAFDFTTTITANTTIYAKWNRVSSGGGGSSGGSSYSAPVSSTTGTVTHSGTVDKPLLTDHCALHDPSYTDEENKAYQFACKHRITTMETIKKARIHDQVTRAEFAKMISSYAQNVLGKKPNTDLQCTFADQNQVNTELSNFITTSCQLGLMGIKMEQNRFLPNKTLSRAEVATVISRLYGFAEDSTPYYKDHLKAMNTKGFITKPMPHMTEVRGYIFIMLERIATTLK